MNKSVLTIVGIVVALLAGYFAYSAISDDPESSETSKDSSNQTSDNTQPTEKTGSYIDYSQAALDNAGGTKVLFFHASWCPYCRALEEDIEKNGVPENTTIFKIDWDENQSLRQKYGVTQTSTLIKIDDDGNEIARFSTYAGESTISSVEENLL